MKVITGMIITPGKVAALIIEPSLSCSVEVNICIKVHGVTWY